jgi:hypothetical protein
MADEKNQEQNGPEEITLSAALLAPLNAIFEAQIHAARAFLSFILQMGFRHRYSKQEISELKKEREKNEAVLEEIEEETKAQKRLLELERKSQKSSLNEEEVSEQWRLRLKYGDLYLQKFDFFDNVGNASSVLVPNLALLPINPLAVNSANFKFELNIATYSDSYDQMGSVEGAQEKRPWFLINPKRIKGNFSKGSSDEKTITIEVNVTSTEMPYGLDKLLTSLTNNIGMAKMPEVDEK